MSAALPEPPVLTFTSEPMSVILPALQAALQRAGTVVFTAPDPDGGLGRYAGEVTEAGLHRSWATWADLADLLGAHLLTPAPLPGGRVRAGLRRWASAPDPDAGGYAPGGAWGRVDKLEDPVFLLTFLEALERVSPPEGGRVLALGGNAGRELDALALAFPGRSLHVTGLDLSPDAVAAARERHPGGHFEVRDVMTLPDEALGRFDLILALSLLQSPGVRQDVLISALVRHHLTPPSGTGGGGLILGYPNARYRDGTLSYGARTRNYRRPDLSLITADVTDARRRLQKHGFRVFVTGKYELLVTATPV